MPSFFVAGSQPLQHRGSGRQVTSSPPAGTPRRDYVSENRKAIRELEDDVRHQHAFTDEIRRIDEAKKKWKMNRFQDIESKVTAIMRKSCDSLQSPSPYPPIAAAGAGAIASPAAATTAAAAAASHSTSIYPTPPSTPYLQRGTLQQRILDQSTKVREKLRTHDSSPLFLSSPTTAEAAKAASFSPLERKPAVPRARDFVPLLRPTIPKNHIINNRRAAIHLSSSSSSSSSPPPCSSDDSSTRRTGGCARHNAFGRVPSYLLAIKQAQLAAEELRRATMKGRHSDIPPGMRLLTEEERSEALAALDAQEREIQSMLLKIPLRVDTPSMTRKKQALEARLVEVGASQEIFSKPRVLIKDG